MTERVKFPKTWHVPWSTGTSDDKTLNNDDHFRGMQVVVTLKMDGENTTMTKEYLHARSLYDPVHPSQTWVKQLRGNIAYELPDNMRVHGENLYAKHTVQYDDLPTYFMVFGISEVSTLKNGKGYDEYLGWYDVEEIAEILGLTTVPVIYRGVYNREAIIKAYEPYKDLNEGYVIRNLHSFEYTKESYAENVAKYVNPGFRQTLKENNVHWASAPVIPNKLRKNE